MVEHPFFRRFQTVAGPALTGSTTAWGILSLVSDVTSFWTPSAIALPSLWLVTLALSALLTWIRKLAHVYASIVTVTFGSAFVMAESAATAYAARYTENKVGNASDVLPMFLVMYLFVVAAVGVFWIPLVCFNSRRHRLHAEAMRGATVHA